MNIPPRESLCECGHPSDWHSHGGAGDCEHDAECRCSQFSASQQVLFPDTWRREQRGGYGFIANVPCRFMGRTEKRVKVLALKADGTSVPRYIAPESFIPGSAA